MSDLDTMPRTLAETVARASTRHPGVRYATVYGAVLRGELQAERRGSRWLLTDEQMEQYLAKVK